MAAPVVHVVDDDAAVRASLVMLLEAEGLAARPYASAESFLAIAGARRGCVLADVQMGGMDGLELVARLQARGLGMPVVLMTGRPDAGLAARALRLGAVSLLDKPFTSEALLAALGSAMMASR